MMQTRMLCRVLVRFVSCFCFVSFTAAKCNPEMCGSMNVSYPFWINNHACGYPGFQITCTGKDSGATWVDPYLSIASSISNSTEQYYNIMDIGYTGYLVINSFYIYAQSCEANSSAASYLEPPPDGPFTISNSNSLLVVGCNAFGNYSFGGLEEVGCVSKCDSQNDRPYCRYGCCEINLPNNRPSINFTGGGVFPLLNSTSNKYYNECGFSTIFDPSTFKVPDNKTSLYWGEGKKASYGLRLNWGIGLQNCSMAERTANYSCSTNAECIDSPSGKGHVCRCLSGYKGNGYFNGTDCTDIDECSDKNSNMCVEKKGGGICHNFGGSYNCSCAKGYEGDGFRNGTRCMYTSSNHAVLPAIIGSVSSFVVVCLVASLVVWWLKKRHLKLVEA